MNRMVYDWLPALLRHRAAWLRPCWWPASWAITCPSRLARSIPSRCVHAALKDRNVDPDLPWSRVRRTRAGAAPVELAGNRRRRLCCACPTAAGGDATDATSRKQIGSEQLLRITTTDFHATNGCVRRGLLAQHRTGFFRFAADAGSGRQSPRAFTTAEPTVESTSLDPGWQGLDLPNGPRPDPASCPSAGGIGTSHDSRSGLCVRVRAVPLFTRPPSQLRLISSRRFLDSRQ